MICSRSEEKSDRLEVKYEKYFVRGISKEGQRSKLKDERSGCNRSMLRVQIIGQRSYKGQKSY